MKILFYRYGSICEPDIIESLNSLEFTIKAIDLEIYNKNIPQSEIITTVTNTLYNEHFDFIFSVNYYPVLSEISRIFKILYISWTVDSPVLELLSDTISNQYNRIFLFDYEQYKSIYQYNPDNIFYLPLATNTTRWDNVINNTSKDTQNKWKSDISFVGSLYTEKCPYDKLDNPPEYLKGYLEGIMNAQQNIYGGFFINELLPDNIQKEFIKHIPDYYQTPTKARKDDASIIALNYLGMKITSNERCDIMRMLGSKYNVDIYTGSNTSNLPVNNKGFVKTHTEMPLVFHNSKINLNITCKSIRSGLSQRIWDVLGCNGFLLTNYQTEIPEYFTIGEDLDTYNSLDELAEKVEFYLNNDSLREKIALNGYNKVKKYHTYSNRLLSLFNNL